MVVLKVTVRVEAEIPQTLHRYGKMRIPPVIMVAVGRKAGRLSMRFEGESMTLKVDKYGRVTLPPQVVEKAKGRDKVLIEAVNGEVRLAFQ
ncbi:MAG: hypothetical protein QXK39_00405 [Nitrososphaerota archaeon]